MIKTGLIGKRGQTTPETEANQTIIYVLFSMVILIIGMLLVQQFSDSVNIQAKFMVENTEHALLSARLMNSATCLAWEEQIKDKTIVRAGIVDFEKLKRGANSCAGSAFFMRGFLADDTQIVQTGASNMLGGKNTVTDTFIVKFYRNGKLEAGRLEITL